MIDILAFAAYRSVRGILKGSLVVLLISSAAPLGMAAQDSLLVPRSKGSPKAPVTVYEMGDFQCNHCRDFTVQTLPTIDKEYIATGKVHWIFINFPLTTIHANAEAAAEFAACASKQGRFWQTHDRLYASQDTWGPLKSPGAFFTSQIPGLGLNQEAMLTCLRSGSGRSIVQEDAAGAERSGATGTPTFYIEGGMMSGAQPIEVFRKVLDSIYTVKTKKKD